MSTTLRPKHPVVGVRTWVELAHSWLRIMGVLLLGCVGSNVSVVLKIVSVMTGYLVFDFVTAHPVADYHNVRSKLELPLKLTFMVH